MARQLSGSGSGQIISLNHHSLWRNQRAEGRSISPYRDSRGGIGPLIILFVAAVCLPSALASCLQAQCLFVHHSCSCQLPLLSASNLLEN